MRAIWFGSGLFCLALGGLGVILPLLPHTVFFLLAAFCFSRSSPRLHTWMVTHPVIGPPIEDWRKNGAIRTPAKWVATGSIMVTFAISVILGIPYWGLIAQAVVLTAVTIFIWTRPSGPRSPPPPDPKAIADRRRERKQRRRRERWAEKRKAAQTEGDDKS